MMNEATTGELRAAEIDLLWQTAPHAHHYSQQGKAQPRKAGCHSDGNKRNSPVTEFRDRPFHYWRQFAIFRELGIRTVFVGMFDEVDEGTAIYKVSNQIPVGKYFVTYEGLPSDYYLKATGEATLRAAF